MVVLPAFYPLVFFKVTYSAISVLHNYMSSVPAHQEDTKNKLAMEGETILSCKPALTPIPSSPTMKRMTPLAAALVLTLPCSKLLWEVNQIIVTHSSWAISFQLNLGLKPAHFTFTLVTATLQVITGSAIRNWLLQNCTLDVLQLVQCYIFYYFFFPNTVVLTVTNHIF